MGLPGLVSGVANVPWLSSVTCLKDFLPSLSIGLALPLPPPPPPRVFWALE